MQFKNPFRRNEQPKQQAVRRGLHPKTEEALEILRVNPGVSYDDLAKALNLSNPDAAPFIQHAERILLKERLKRQPDQQQATQAPPVASEQAGEVNLVNYTPEQLVQHVDTTLSGVHFGMSASHQFMETIAEVWAVIGPIVLLCGTAGEVYAFIWQYASNTAWWIGLSVIATVIVLEATFMVVSYKSATIRDRAEARPEGPSAIDKKKLTRYKYTWFTLATGVAIGQIAFLVAAMEARLTNVMFLVGFALGRTIFTLASDYYTAFIHESKPTTGEQAKEKQEQRAKMAAALLRQKANEVTIINEGIMQVSRAHMLAKIERDTQETERKIKELENRNRVETLQMMHDQAAMFNRLGANVMRALFDPQLPDNEREKLLGTLQGFMNVGNRLPPPTITEEE